MAKEINSVIDRLADIDSGSAQIMETAQRAKTEYADSIKKQERDFDNALNADIEKNVKDFKASVAAQNKAQIAECRQACDRDLAALDDFMFRKGESLADDIFHRVIKE